MAYTNPFSTATPAGSDAASGAAARIREIKDGLTERFADLGLDMTETTPTHYEGTFHSILSWADFLPFTTFSSGFVVNQAAQQYGLYGNNVSVTGALYARVMVPSGSTIRQMDVIGRTDTGASIVVTLEEINYDLSGALTPVVYSTLSMPASTEQSLLSTTFASPLTISTASTPIFYYVKVVLSTGTTAANTWIQGVILHYTRAKIYDAV